jgi:phosphoserine aminotransferase
MSNRVVNLYAGPSVLPVEVLKELHENFMDYNGLGLSLIETSHRSKEYDEVHMSAISLIKELMNIPDNYKVLFLGGGATMQFSMVPMNFLPEGKSCDFTLSGAWAEKAYDDAVKIGKVNVIFDGKDKKYTSLPTSLNVSKDAAYVHITSNETIGGLQWMDYPDTGNVPLIADMSSDIMSRPVDINKFAMIYAGAQKNLGPAGVTLAIIRDDLLERCPSHLTKYLNYRTHSDKDSLYNTPPVFSIWAMKLGLEHIKKQGGLVAMKEKAELKSGLLYDAMQASNGFYRCPVDEAFRSQMNVVFNLPTEDLEKQFIAEAKESGFVGMKGHRSVGGCRASIYNSLPVEDVKKLVDFMHKFHRANA